MPSPTIPGRAFSFSGVVLDGAVLVGLIAFGWLLIGYYTGYQYLYTGYEDWIYHAFRVQSLERHGMTSWDHVWSNGMNFWRLYQYGQHYLILWLTQLTDLSITQALLYSVVGIYIGLRAVLYLLLRALGINRLFAVMATMASYTMVQEWASLQDYSIYIAFFLVPAYVFLWIKAFENHRLIYVLTAVTGALWSIHPVMAFSMSTLWAFLILFSSLKDSFRRLIALGVVYGLSALPFLGQYFTAGYHFTNPIFKSAEYLSTSVLPVWNGFSGVYWVLVALSWALLIWKSHIIAGWAKVLLFFSSFYLLLIYLGQNSYLPDFFLQFQFSRAIPAIALVLIFAFGAIFYQSFRWLQSRFVLSIFLAFIAVTAVHSMDIASGYYVAPAAHQIDNPVASFFANHPLPTGTVYYSNISEASFFAPEGIRYAVSYNEHLQPHPYSTRLRLLMRGSTGYTGISQAHLESIENYATVLGIEYLFLPGSSPLIKGLTQKEASLFEQVAEIESPQLMDTTVVLKYTGPLVSAFVIERRDIPGSVWSDHLPLPTLHVSTYRPWDQRMRAMAEIVRSPGIQAVPLHYPAVDQLRVDLSSIALERYEDPVLIVSESYDRAWRVIGRGLTPQPTTLRLMALSLKDVGVGSEITFENHWPKWHWPLQSSGVAMIGLMLIHFAFFRRRSTA